MNDVSIKKLNKSQFDAALTLVWEVFLRFEAPDYSREGIEEFHKTICNEDYLRSLTMFGAFIKGSLVGVIATREIGQHITLFFVKEQYQRQGIGKRLFEKVKKDGMTVNASPYAVPIYQKLGFQTTSDEQCVNGIRFTQMRYALPIQKNVVFCKTRAEWRAWLACHFETESEVWFVFPTLASGEQGVSYNDAVEEALCFGWIDGRAGTLDKTHQLRRFTPRRKNSPYSQPNIERLILLDKEGAIHPKVRPLLEKTIRTPYVFPQDVVNALREDPVVWEHFQAFTESYKRIRVAYIDAARDRPDEFQKRLKNFIEKTRENKLIVGYGGVDKYYR